MGQLGLEVADAVSLSEILSRAGGREAGGHIAPGRLAGMRELADTQKTV
jgi:hypothetical protein